MEKIIEMWLNPINLGILFLCITHPAWQYHTENWNSKGIRTWKKLSKCGSTRSTWEFCFCVSPAGSGSWRTATLTAGIN